MDLEKTNLTKRQKDLLRYLEQNPNKFHTQLEISQNVEGYVYSYDIRNHLCVLWEDVEAINKNEEVEEFIYYKKYQCKIATREEIEKYKHNLTIKALKLFKRSITIDKKLANQDKARFLTVVEQNNDDVEVMDYFKLFKKEFEENVD